MSTSNQKTIIDGKKRGDILRGSCGIAKHDGVEIWYETFTPRNHPKGAVLLVMGIGSDALVWPDAFILPFIDAGYLTIRFDHRGLGLSDRMADWRYTQAYTFDEMAGDGMAIIAALGLEKVHLVGVSMGGMIAQTMAIKYPCRVRSLTSIMSTGFYKDSELPSVSLKFLLGVMRIALRYGLRRTEENIINMQIAGRTLLRGASLAESEVEEMVAKTFYKLRKRNGYNVKAGLQHYVAMVRSGSRLDALKQLSTPALVIHGKADPLVPLEHGLKCARIIPDAEALWIDGLGHDLPDAASNLMTRRIVAWFQHLEMKDD